MEKKTAFIWYQNKNIFTITFDSFKYIDFSKWKKMSLLKLFFPDTTFSL